MAIEIYGRCDARFAPVKEAFSANLDEGLDAGASLAITIDGKYVVDIWGGMASRTRPWEENTIVSVFSVTKIVTGLAMLMLIDRGEVDLDAPVAQYWPEFAQGGKAHVTVRDVLSHQAGVPGFTPPIPFEMQADWPAITARIAAEPHWFGGRRELAYHIVTWGFIVGELIRRVSGRMPAPFMREEITSKAGAYFLLGLTDRADLARLASTLMGELPPPPPGDLNAAYFRAMTSVLPGDRTSWEHRSADNPGGGGYANGRSIARICAIYANGGALDGMRYLSESIVREARREHARASVPPFGMLRIGLGLALDSPDFETLSPASFHFGGFGGAFGMMDADAKLSLGYAQNKLHLGPDPRKTRIFAALRSVVR